MKIKNIGKMITFSTLIGGVMVLEQASANPLNINSQDIDENIENINIRCTSLGQVVNVSTNLRIREKPSTNSNVLGNMIGGTKVNIIAKEGDWYKIQWNSITGYVYKDYLEEIKSTSHEDLICYGQVHNVSTNLRVRSQASTNSTILGYINNGTNVTIVSKMEDWYKIKYNDGYGFVHSDYIKINCTFEDSNEDIPNILEEKGHVYNLQTSKLRVRSGASTESEVLGYLDNDDIVTIVGESGNWYQIKYNNRLAYVSKDYVKKGLPTGSGNDGSDGNEIKIGRVVNVNSNLRVRKSASTNSQVLGYLLNGENVEILGKEENWYKIKFGKTTGYVSCDYISTDSSDSENTNSEKYNIILNAMKKHIGTPYVWAGSGEPLTTENLNKFKSWYPVEAAQGKYSDAERFVNQGMLAFDCSGLMQWGFRQAGINIGRSTYHQINNGVEVSLNDLKLGDLLFTKDIGHVGMYIGNGQWIESPKSFEYIRIKDVPWSAIGRARRILD